MGHRDIETTQRYAGRAPRTRDAELVAAAFTRTTAEPVAVLAVGLDGPSFDRHYSRSGCSRQWVRSRLGGTEFGLGLRLLDPRRPSIAAAGVISRIMSTDFGELERRVKALEDAMSLVVKRLGADGEVKAAKQAGHQADDLSDPTNTAMDAAVGPEGL
jgi:hypothetical protein